MRIAILAALVAVFLWAQPAKANVGLCASTKELAAELISHGFAFTSTFTARQGIVLQLFVSPIDGYVMTWARDLGETSCIISTGPVWIWAGEPI